MNKGELTNIALKILAIYFIIQGINAIATVVTYRAISTTSKITYAVNTSLPLVFFIVLGIILWIFSNKFSGIIVRDEGQLEITNDSIINATELQTVLFSVIGLVLIGSSLPQIITMLMSMYQVIDIPDGPIRVLPYLTGEITKLILGLVIFLGSQKLVVILKSIRNVGIKE